jgi:hypothetical protein
VLHTVAGIVVSYDLLFGVIALADDGQFLHVKLRPLKFLHGFLCLGVAIVNGYNWFVSDMAYSPFPPDGLCCLAASFSFLTLDSLVSG